ncbi:MAG: CHAP domain-containing protein [Hyphomonadaceae bacterium]|nr:CHAP domain-containing protein [Hyphomonadaceae bacterium]
MTRQRRISATRAAVFGLVAILASACTSSRAAPITYGHARPPLAAAAAAPVTPPRNAPRLDLTSRPFDDHSTPVIMRDQPPSECVPYARSLSGVQIWGDAVTWWAQAQGKYVRSGRPAEGSVLVLRGWKDETRGHVAVVKAILSERIIRVDHANWMRGGEVSINVPVVDVSAANDWSQIRVWHIPGGYWGGRTYDAQGFIHPYRLNGSAGLSG